MTNIPSAHFQYSFLNTNYLRSFKQEIESLPLENIIELPVGQLFVRDGISLHPNSSELVYNLLEARLVTSIKYFESGEPFKSSKASDTDDKFWATLDYVSMLQERFKTDPEKVNKLYDALFKAFIEKIEKVGYNPQWYFSNTRYLQMFQKAEREYRKGQAMQSISHNQTSQQPL